MSRGDLDLPFLCPFCGEKFGTGNDIGLLSVVTSVQFTEPTPCCGVRAKGTMTRNSSGVIEIAEMERV